METTDEVTPMFIAMGIFIALSGIGVFLSRRSIQLRIQRWLYPDSDQAAAPSYTAPSLLVYKGYELHFDDATLVKVVSRYNPYFNKLGPFNKAKFIERLKRFIRKKTFIIHATEAYREMPILISASAIQLTFGLEEHLLEPFSKIVIHPDAYIKTDPLRVLMGNVQGDTITLSWKHFLDDYLKPTDGKNVGLHEMAHALQLLSVLPGKRKDPELAEDFRAYEAEASISMIHERSEKDPLFDSYALSNKDEFWATSIELFFERPAELKEHYPQLYGAICDILEQDPTIEQELLT